MPKGTRFKRKLRVRRATQFATPGQRLGKPSETVRETGCTVQLRDTGAGVGATKTQKHSHNQSNQLLSSATVTVTFSVSFSFSFFTSDPQTLSFAFRIRIRLAVQPFPFSTRSRCFLCRAFSVPLLLFHSSTTYLALALPANSINCKRKGNP